MEEIKNVNKLIIKPRHKFKLINQLVTNIL